MSKLTEYTAATGFDANDIFIKDGTGGTKKITVENAAVELAGLISNENRRNIYRGKSLGTSVTADQKAAIKAGTFKGMFIGDYWTIDSVRWRIADMDYWYNAGNTNVCDTHHLVIVPDSSILSGDDRKMNDSNTTVGGYKGSKMFKTTMTKLVAKVEKSFPSYVLEHDEYLTSDATGGHDFSGEWVTGCKVDLMNEFMVHGSRVSSTSTVSTIDSTQLALFRLNPKLIHCRMDYWLRDVYSEYAFVCVTLLGSTAQGNASSTLGVRPVFAIGSK